MEEIRVEFGSVFNTMDHCDRRARKIFDASYSQFMICNMLNAVRQLKDAIFDYRWDDGNL